jgi:LL-H family phage holin
MIINGIDVTPIITAIIEVLAGVVITLISTKVIPYIHSKVDQEQLEFIKSVVKIAVKAAEQLFEKAQGAEKLEYAMNMVLSALKEKGIEINKDLLRSYIEAAVLELHRALED